MKTNIFFGILFSVFLLLMIPNIPVVNSQYSVEAHKQKIDYISHNLQEELAEPPMILLLLLLSIVDIPLIILSLIVSIIEYLIYIPVIIIFLIYDYFFWEYNPFIPYWPPSELAVLFFTILLMITGIPIIFIIATGLYFTNLGYEDFSDYFRDAMRIYGNVISNLLMPDFGQGV